MGKLTKAQIRVLKRMADGDEVWTVSGRRPSAFWYRKLSDRSPSFATLHALWRMKAIVNYNDDSSGKRYRITDLGRSTLKQEDAT